MLSTMPSHGTRPPPRKPRPTSFAGALRTVFGDDFVSVPQFTLPADAVADLTAALAHSTGGGLTKHLTDLPPAGSGRDFPEDDWLHGVARVRTRMHHLENVLLLSDALPDATAPVLTPLQLPHSAGQPWLALEIARRCHAARRPPALHLGARRPVSLRPRSAGYSSTSGPRRSLTAPRPPGWPSTTIAPTPNHRRPGCSRCPSSADGSWSWDDLVAAVQRRARLGEAACGRTGAFRRYAVQRAAACDSLGLDLPRDIDLEQPAAQREDLRPTRRGARMTDIHVVTNLPEALLTRLHPAITRWNRLEGRPRTHDFDRALRAEVRDAMWMLSRQWQLGEFVGDDAGSPILARACLDLRLIDRYQAAAGGGAAVRRATTCSSHGSSARRCRCRWTISTCRSIFG